RLCRSAEGFPVTSGISGLCPGVLGCVARSVLRDDRCGDSLESSGGNVCVHAILMTFTAKLKSYRTLVDALAAAPRTQPFATMWETNREGEQETVTFGQFLDLAGGYANLYQTRGLGPGDTVVLVMPQSIALLAAFTGALIMGAIPTILAYPTFKVDTEKYRYGLVGGSNNLKARLTVID